ncbi:phage tail assembly protein [Acidovorax sp. LjRoot129]|uniref:phage tail assembly protein n=1 Tax=Acidovorax sp. LjRoot129 TaxID=3342260 RepID=UPI003ED0AE04
MTTQDQTTAPANAATKVADKAAPNTVTLDTPVRHGDQLITAVTLRKPKAGELRGIALTELLQLKVEAIQAVVPRISSPMLHKQDMANLDPADLVALGGVVIGFLLSKEQKADFLTE